MLRHGTPLDVYRVDIGEGELGELVEEFLGRIEGRTSASPAIFQRSQLNAFQASARTLFALLISPAAASIAQADRIAKSPDGPLHRLPFSALVLERTGETEHSRSEYMGQMKPIHLIESMTTLSLTKKLKTQRAIQARPSIVAFADPNTQTTGSEGTTCADLELTPIADGRPSLLGLPQRHRGSLPRERMEPLW